MATVVNMDTKSSFHQFLSGAITNTVSKCKTPPGTYYRLDINFHLGNKSRSRSTFQNGIFIARRPPAPVYSFTTARESFSDEITRNRINQTARTSASPDDSHTGFNLPSVRYTHWPLTILSNRRFIK